MLEATVTAIVIYLLLAIFYCVVMSFGHYGFKESLKLAAFGFVVVSAVTIIINVMTYLIMLAFGVA